MGCFDCRLAIDKLKICKGDCCGCIPLDKTLVKVFEKRQQRKVTQIVEWPNGTEIMPITEDGMCVFLKPDYTCAIYDHRPEVCKLYGVTKHEDLQCPHLKPSGTGS
jgi:Fe-S-cluster containining protein